MSLLNLFEDQFPVYVQDKIVEHVSRIDRKGDKWNFRCPLCGDSKKSMKLERGWYYLRNNTYHCFNCGANCQGGTLIAQLEGKTIDEIKRDFLISIRKEKYNVNIPSIMQAPLKKRTSFKLEDSWTDESPLISEFVSSRKIDIAPFKPKNWKLWYDTKTKRIVLPWTRNGEIKTFQLRATMKNQLPKYMFPSNSDKDIFGLDSIDDNLGVIFMFEGALDSIFCVNGVAVGGVNLTDKQTDLLKIYLSEKIFFLDNQNLDKTAKEKMEKIARSDSKQKMFVWPKKMCKCKDVNEHVITFNENPFIDLDFLKSRVFSGARALLEMKNF